MELVRGFGRSDGLHPHADLERAALIAAGRLDSDLPARRFHDLLDHGEAQADALAIVCLSCSRLLAEASEELRYLLLRDSLASILHVND